MRGLDATQQTSPEPVSRMSVETTHPPNEHDNIGKQLDKHDGKIPRLPVPLDHSKNRLAVPHQTLTPHLIRYL
jgi:hypothetical protein